MPEPAVPLVRELAPIEPETAQPAVKVTPAVSTVAAAPKASAKVQPSPPAVKPTAKTTKAPAKPQGGVFSPADHDSLVAQNKNEVVVAGTLKEIGYSSTKKTMYLIFEGTRDSADFRGAISSKDATGDLSEPALGKLFGKKIRLAGKIRLEPVGPRSRPVIDIANRTAIKLDE